MSRTIRKERAMDATDNRCLNCGDPAPCICTEPMPANEVYARPAELAKRIAAGSAMEGTEARHD